MVFIASIIPAKIKFERKKAPKHLKKVFRDLISKPIKTSMDNEMILIIIFNIGFMFSIKIISDRIPPVTEETRNLDVLCSHLIKAALDLSKK